MDGWLVGSDNTFRDGDGETGRYELLVSGRVKYVG